MRLLRPGIRAGEAGPLIPPGAARWIRAGLTLLAIAAAAWVGIRWSVPMPPDGAAGWVPPPDDLLPFKNVVVAALAVLAGGKCLYDTFFFDRHP